MKAKTEITGRLENWTFGFGCLFGEIYDDAHKRFPDGRQVRTSYIETPIVSLKEGVVAQTMNSKYLLGKKAI